MLQILIEQKSTTFKLVCVASEMIYSDFKTVNFNTLCPLYLVLFNTCIHFF